MTWMRIYFRFSDKDVKATATYLPYSAGYVACDVSWVCPSIFII